ncbi:hypothetical protein LEP1GSC045_2874 [Leptospira interrogans serovar Pomona str. Kennewicki LC82-25]|nr:hypothetical protein LEP1GSC045_2874 [Leptospira interrogans serovar Pomona str. Kennewicki LC82-25]EKN95462.1 hypothetical protein LEP1GSC014_0085 [Leptospira interrogans serovar Pomona str. Pomona]EKO70385.1 hypothetical protein LEP1GSC069_2007 [Leptospira interrogans serovar Canicola str. Fiocruz LV133]EMF33041.1 hypothetical protein LEP1GSC201_0115 [Leptospira interrogans serovar Pomona str. Fox 32256]EMJ64104.1 hypothetical protein LEP1GSC197_1266 [Leptospira interrogans serovar Pomona 
MPGLKSVQKLKFQNIRTHTFYNFYIEFKFSSYILIDLQTTK